MTSDSLTHHGIKGQKWGIRRFQNDDGSLTTKGKQRYKETNDNKKKKDFEKDIKTARKYDSKHSRTLSDEELRKKTERLKLEKQLKELTNDDINPGRNYVHDLLKSTGKKVIPVMLAGAASYAAKAAMEKKFDIKEAAKYIAANPNKKK